MYMTTYTVTGQGPFPLDMLRYDRSSPRNPEDASRIALSIQEIGNRYTYTIALVVYHLTKKSRGITVGRWESFGFGVTIEDTIRLT